MNFLTCGRGKGVKMTFLSDSKTSLRTWLIQTFEYAHFQNRAVAETETGL